MNLIRNDQVAAKFNAKTLVCGDAGSGKTILLGEIINQCIQNGVGFLFITSPNSFPSSVRQEYLIHSPLIFKNGVCEIFTNQPTAFFDFKNQTIKTTSDFQDPIDSLLENAVKNNYHIIVDETYYTPFLLQKTVSINPKSFIVVTQKYEDFIVSTNINPIDFFDYFLFNEIKSSAMQQLKSIGIDVMPNNGTIFNFSEICVNSINEGSMVSNEIDIKFSNAMNAALAANTHKGNWSEWKPQPEELISYIMYQTSLLNMALAKNEVSKIKDCSISIANYSEKLYSLYPNETKISVADIEKIKEEEENYAIADEIDNKNSETKPEPDETKKEDPEFYSGMKKTLPPEVLEFGNLISQIFTKKSLRDNIAETIQPAIDKAKELLEPAVQSSSDKIDKIIEQITDFSLKQKDTLNPFANLSKEEIAALIKELNDVEKYPPFYGCHNYDNVFNSEKKELELQDVIDNLLTFIYETKNNGDWKLFNTLYFNFISDLIVLINEMSLEIKDPNSVVHSYINSGLIEFMKVTNAQYAIFISEAGALNSDGYKLHFVRDFNELTAALAYYAGNSLTYQVFAILKK